MQVDVHAAVVVLGALLVALVSGLVLVPLLLVCGVFPLEPPCALDAARGIDGMRRRRADRAHLRRSLRAAAGLLGAYEIGRPSVSASPTGVAAASASSAWVRTTPSSLPRFLSASTRRLSDFTLVPAGTTRCVSAGPSSSRSCDSFRIRA